MIGHFRRQSYSWATAGMVGRRPVSGMVRQSPVSDMVRAQLAARPEVYSLVLDPTDERAYLVEFEMSHPQRGALAERALISAGDDSSEQFTFADDHADSPRSA